MCTRNFARVPIRLSEQDKNLIGRAAAIVGETCAQFALGSARRRAVDVLLDPRLSHLDAAAGEAFLQVFESPPAPIEALRNLLRS